MAAYRTRALAPLTLLLLLTGSAGAQDHDFDRFSITGGAYDIFRYDSTMALTDTNSGIGISFTPEDSLGWKSEQTAFRLDASYRFSEKHGLTASWYEITTNGNRGLIKDIDWVDINGDPAILPVGAAVRSGLKMEIFKIGYFWSFYHSDKVELSAGAGLHVARIGVDMEAEITTTGVEAADADTTVPLPVVGFRLNYDVTPKLSWYLQGQLFSIELDDWDGTYSDLQFGALYRAFEHVGFGIGIGGNGLDVTEETKHHRFEFQNRMTGLHAFVSAYF